MDTMRSGYAWSEEYTQARNKNIEKFCKNFNHGSKIIISIKLIHFLLSIRYSSVYTILNLSIYLSTNIH